MLVDRTPADRQDTPPSVTRAVNGHPSPVGVLRSMPMAIDTPAPPAPTDLNGSRPTAADRPSVAPNTDSPSRIDRRDVPTVLRWFTEGAVWILSAVVTYLAATGQVEFAEWAGITDHRKYLVPASLDLVAACFLLVGYVQGRRGNSPALMWSLAALVGAVAVYTNVEHAGERAGLLYGGFSAVAIVLWFVKLYYQYRAHRRDTGQAGAPTPNFGSLWLLNPRLAMRGLLVAKRLQIAEVDPALRYAEVWIAVYDDAKRGHNTGSRIGQRKRRRTAWRSVHVSAGHPVADLPSSAEVPTVSVIDRPEGTTDRRRPTESGRKPTARRRQARPKRPTDRRSANRPTDRPTVYAPAADTPTDSHTGAAVGNARLLRDRYGADLPSEYMVRKDTGWSLDRARPAIAAHKAGADLTAKES